MVCGLLLNLLPIVCLKLLHCIDHDIFSYHQGAQVHWLLRLWVTANYHFRGTVSHQMAALTKSVE